MMDDYAPCLIEAKQYMVRAELGLAQGGKDAVIGLANLRFAISALLNAERVIMKAAGMPRAGAR